MTLPQSDSFRAFGNMLSADHAKSEPIPYLWVRVDHDPPLQSVFADPVPPPLPEMKGFIAEDGFSAGGGAQCRPRKCTEVIAVGTPVPGCPREHQNQNPDTPEGCPYRNAILTECAQPSNFVKKSTHSPKKVEKKWHFLQKPSCKTKLAVV